MKAIGLAAILLIPCVSQAGFFVRKDLHTDGHLAVGVGSTLEHAIADAKAGIPQGTKYDFYELDPDATSPSYQCVNDAVWNEKDECQQGGTIQYVIPLRRVTR